MYFVFRNGIFYGSQKTPLGLYLHLLSSCIFEDFCTTQGETFLEGVRVLLKSGAKWQHINVQTGRTTTLFSHVVDEMARWSSWIIQPGILCGAHIRFLEKLLHMCDEAHNCHLGETTIMSKDGRQLLALVGLSEISPSVDFVTGITRLLKYIIRHGGNPEYIFGDDITRSSSLLLSMSPVASIISCLSKGGDKNALTALVELLSATTSHKNWQYLASEVVAVVTNGRLGNENSSNITKPEGECRPTCKLGQILTHSRQLQTLAAIELYKSLGWRLHINLARLRLPSVLESRLNNFSL